MILFIVGAFVFCLWMGRRISTRERPATGFENFLGVLFLAWLVVWIVQNALA